MPDHINIHQPDHRSDDRWAVRLRVKTLEAEIENLRMERDKYRDDLEAIFTRLGRGDPVWLYSDSDEKIIAIREPEQEPDQ